MKAEGGSEKIRPPFLLCGVVTLKGQVLPSGEYSIFVIKGRRSSIEGRGGGSIVLYFSFLTGTDREVFGPCLNPKKNPKNPLRQPRIPRILRELRILTILRLFILKYLLNINKVYPPD